MLAELAAANAAFSVIKQAIGNGQELSRVAKQASEYFNSKSSIAKKANKGGNKSDMEAFMALETLKQQEEELRELMIYAGRANMYDDWLQFQSDCKRKREKEAKQNTGANRGAVGSLGMSSGIGTAGSAKAGLIGSVNTEVQNDDVLLPYQKL